jgi:triphosphoribosyl-dephospho-CoA synthase
MPDVGLCAQVACIWEATARKPGNVHRYRDFADACYPDFLLSAAAIAPVLARAAGRPVGLTVLESVQATRAIVGHNTNLGIVLLLTPLAAVPDGEEPRAGVERVLTALDLEDARLVYRAIRLAAPGGLGRTAEQDVAAAPTLPLREIMALAADRDLVARQYADGFREVFELGVPALTRRVQTGSIETTIVGAFLELLAAHPDSLIARKCGAAVAGEASERAAAVLRAGWPEPPEGWRRFEELDGWLRADGHRRNPGTTADLVTASLFVALRGAIITLPPTRPWAGAWPARGESPT